MPTIDVDYSELENLLKLNLQGNMEKLDEILAYVKAEVKGYNQQDNNLTIEMKDTNRPDLWSVEGLARGLRGYLNQEKGLKQYSAGKSIVKVNVNPKLFNIRPYICCSIVKDVHLNDKSIRGLMHLQDKLDKTYGRSRQKTSIGIYDFNLITPPLEYTVAKPDQVSFVPLGFTEKLTLNEMLERHPKGIEYGHIVKNQSVYPILLDSNNKPLSFPPIINSNDLGKITEDTKDLLVEVTGTIHQTVLNTLNLVTLNLIDVGGKAFSATINYPKSNYKQKNVGTPNFNNRCMQLSVDYTNQLLGLKLTAKKISELLCIAGFSVKKITQEKVFVLVPCYRIDVMHQVDLIEDVAIAYGYNNMEPLWRDLPTTGCAKPDQRLINVARDFMVGLGFQEVLNYTLTNPENLFDKMNAERQTVVELYNPKIVTMTCLRNWLLPSLIEFLSNNQSVEFPQKIFELGKVTLHDEESETKTRNEEWLSAVSTHATAGFSEAKSALDSFFMNFGVDWQIKESSHPSFIEGRAGNIIVDNQVVGIVGEISPKVLEVWKLENPVAGFEVNLQKIIDGKLLSKASLKA